MALAFLLSLLFVLLSLLFRTADFAMHPAERVLPRQDAYTQAATTHMEQVEVHCESSSTVLSLLRAVPPAEGKLALFCHSNHSQSQCKQS
jgi:hypothetical protein